MKIFSTLYSIIKIMCIIGMVLAVLTLGGSAPISAILCLPYCFILAFKKMLNK